MQRYLVLVLVVDVCTRTASADGTAFYYGRQVPDELLQVYERVVVEPTAIADPAPLMGRGARLLAYLSVGELADTSPVPPADLHASWVIGRNPAWKSSVMDLTNPGWRRYLLEDRMQVLWQQGYRGFFLDTLDSYQLAALSDAQKAAQVDAMVTLIAEMHRRYPGVELLINRGFELLPRVASQVAAVVAESLFDGWDAARQRYVRVPDADRRWLQDKLQEVVERHGLPVIVIDYRPPHEREQARATAQRIAALGFEPWVTNAQLDMVGVGVPEVLPRRVLVIYDGAREPLAHALALRLLAPILEYEGYVPVFHDVREPLPVEPLVGRYAGISTWFPGPLQQGGDRYGRWLVAQLDAGMPLAILGDPGLALDRGTLRRLGLAWVSRPLTGKARVTSSDLVGFEARPRPHALHGAGLVAADARLRVHLRVEDDAGPRLDPVITGPWGGLALAPYLLEQGHAGALSWVIDPFAFVTAALAREPLPVPDVTTENGHRLVLAHVDPEGADRRAELRGTPLAGSVVRGVLASQRLPHSTSMRALAAGLAHVVVAERLLLGPGAGLTRARPSLTQLMPLAQPGTRGTLEVLAPIADEDGYRVDDGGAPFGFRRVIETFELTDAPRRLRPIALRYHAYSGATLAGRKALEQVYAWIAAQSTVPVLAAEYADKVLGFYDATLTRYPDGSFRMYGLRTLRTLRLPRALGWPDLARSPAVVAVRDLPQGRYVSMDATPSPRLVLSRTRPDRPFLAGSNARVLEFAITAPDRIRLHLRGHVPVSLVVANLAGQRCVLSGRGFRVRGQRVTRGELAGALRFAVPVVDTGKARLHCRR